MRIGKLNLNIIKEGVRIIKAWTLTKRDVKTYYQVSEWGDDSAPVLDTDVVVADTAVGNVKVVVGVITTEKKALPGEKRIYATDSDGNVVIDIYMKNDGTIELGGIADNAVRYAPLDTGLQTLVTNLNAELLLIQAGITSAGGAYSPTTQSVDISGSKIDEIKVP